jgi:hypothetical protein
MSFDGYLYLGPTLKLGPATKKSSVGSTACWNGECAKYALTTRDASFCVSCGSAITVGGFVGVEENISFHDFINSKDHDNEEWEDEFIQPEFETGGVLYPNDLDDGEYFYHGDISEGMNIVFDEDFETRKAKQLEDFTSKYSGLLVMLQEFGFCEAEIVFVCKIYYS